jgi:hypothetical protein
MLGEQLAGTLNILIDHSLKNIFVMSIDALQLFALVPASLNAKYPDH